MSECMQLIPFDQLMTWAMAEYRQAHTLFGVPVRRPPHPAGRPESRLGLAAGPHTQLAQNIIAGYAAGSRCFELKTVQVLDGSDLTVAKPCISALDEGYNVEWSTELRVPDAFDEYVKAWFALHILAKELGLGSQQGFVFNMSVGYDLKGIQSDKINAFIDGLADASGTPVWQACRRYLLDHVDQFSCVERADIEQISPRICNAITLSTLHGCPADEIEKIAMYLLTEKKLDTFVKCNPTLLGYPFVRSTLDRMGYAGIQFDDHHFKADLLFSDAVPMIKRLQAAAIAQSRRFGVKLSNTLPVEIRQHELPGDEMYLSGRALYPLTIQLAAQLAEAFNGQIRISYCGGADAFNIEQIGQTGIWPITVTTTALKPGGYGRLTQLAEQLESEPPLSGETPVESETPLGGETPVESETPLGGGQTIDVDALRRLADQAAGDPVYQKKWRPAVNRKLAKKVPLLDCFIAPCQQGCPFGQDAPTYIRLVGEGRYLDALLSILSRNPLPFTTGSYCDHRCMAKCTRLDYDEAVNIRGVKLVAAQNAHAELVSRIETPLFDHRARAACLGGTPAGLAAAWFLSRNGIKTTVFERTEALGNLGRPVAPPYRQAVEKDVALLRQAGVRFSEEFDESTTTEMLANRGFTFVFDARDSVRISASIADGIAAGTHFADQVICHVTGKPLVFTDPVVLEKSLDPGQSHPSPQREADPVQHRGQILARKGRLQKAGDPVAEHTRCLECHILCNVCADVCPNRANVAVRVAHAGGGNSDQVLHLDGPCNACGNCTTFCPYDSAPFREKFTLFWNETAFANSPNDGFFLKDRDRSQFAVRLDGMIHELTLAANPVTAADTGLPDGFTDLIRTVVRDYDWLLL